MEFTGRLAVFPASNLVQWAKTERVSGTLVVRRSQREKRLGFRAGRILECRSNHPQEFYGQFLVIHGFLSDEALGRALVYCRTKHVPLGVALGELELLDELTVRATLEQSLGEAVKDLFLWQHGLFYFEDAQIPSRHLDVDLDSTELLFEGMRWIDESARIRQVLIDDEVVVRPGAGLGMSVYTPLERRILEAAEQEVSLRDLHIRVGGVHFPFLSACFSLVEKQALEVARSSPERPAASRELDLKEFLLSVASDDGVVVGAESAIFPLDAIEALVPVWIQRPPVQEIDALPIPLRGFLNGFDGRTTLRRLLSPAAEARADQIELLLVELKRRNLILLPASLDEVERRLDDKTPLRRLVKRLRS